MWGEGLWQLAEGHRLRTYENDEKELHAHFACYALGEIAACLRHIAENTPKLKK